MTKFDRAVELILKHEGGYVDHPSDPGGETKYGISKRSYPHVDIRSLTTDAAKDIYYHDFWLPLKLDKLPYAIAVSVFDYAVNSGKSRAVKTLQAAVGVLQDGALGPATLSATLKQNPFVIAATIRDMRLAFLRALSSFKTFGKGWTRRVNETYEEAISDVN
jgi:lysozyme family protein